MHEHSDEELLVAIAAGPGFLPEFYRRHVAKVTGVGVRRFSTPEDVADFVANVFLEVLRSAGSYDPRRGDAVAWLYGLAGNVAAACAAGSDGRPTPSTAWRGGRCWMPTTTRGWRSASTPHRPCVAPMRPCNSCPTRTGGCWSWSPWTG